jgi:hypothetical protein
MTTFFNFIWWSSKNPNQVSLTIRAGIPFLAMLFTFFHIDIDPTAVVDQLIILINGVLLIVTAFYTLWGLIRKAYLTWKGENKVLQ